MIIRIHIRSVYFTVNISLPDDNCPAGATITLALLAIWDTTSNNTVNNADIE